MSDKIQKSLIVDLRSTYTRLFSRNWVIPTFLVVWVIIVIVPLLIMVAHSFFEMKQYRVVYDGSFKTWESLIDSGRWIAGLRTLRIVLVMTAIEFLVAFPFALWLAKVCKSKATKAVIITLLTIPFFLDPSSRTIIWRAILGKNGIINFVLMETGVISEPIEWMLFSEFAVHFGILAPYFPTMVFPIFLVISLIDDDYLEASRDLGASKLQTLFRIILPLSLPGIVAGGVFTMVPLMATWVEPEMLGGGFVNLLGPSVDAAMRELKYPTAAALSVFVVALLVIFLALLILATRRLGSVGDIFHTMKR